MHNFFFLIQHMSDQSFQRSRNTVLLSSAESKIFVVFLYYLFTGVLQLSTFSLTIKDIDHNIRVLGNYFRCQRSGLNESCSLETEFIEFWSLFAFIVLLLLPAINLFFASKFSSICVMFKCRKYQVNRLRSRVFLTSTTETELWLHTSLHCIIIIPIMA